jgi:hypothetical protein
MTRAIVLLYHSHNISGSEYSNNDHVALASDLETIHAHGGRIVPLSRIAEHVRAGEVGGNGPLLVGLSFDDGPVFDYRDFEHKDFGPQRGFLNILKDFRARHGHDAQPELHATSFVIASDDARRAMERACGYDYVADWLGDAWWVEATRSGLMEIGNHSWDHVHEAPDKVVIAASARNDFSLVQSYPEADAEIRKATRFIEERTGQPCRLFAFPFGHTNDFLVRDYLPHRAAEHGMKAAFGASGGVINAQTSIWNIPRWICGYHWHSSDELAKLISS